MLHDLTLDSFRPLVGTSFQWRLPEHESHVAFELREATALPVRGAVEHSRQPFSLLFHAGYEAPLPQQIYSLTHPAFPDPLELFLVPVGQADGGTLLEAVFN